MITGIYGLNFCFLFLQQSMAYYFLMFFDEYNFYLRKILQIIKV